jgi:hypothetical protein
MGCVLILAMKESGTLSVVVVVFTGTAPAGSVSGLPVSSFAAAAGSTMILLPLCQKTLSVTRIEGHQ